MTPVAPTPLEDRVGSWLDRYADGRKDEDSLYDDLARYVWGIDAGHWLATALREDLHHLLVQYREAHAEWAERDPACGPTTAVFVSACGMDTCGQHRAHLGVLFDTRDLYVRQVMHGTPARAAATARRMGVAQ